jgi:hypothetical protein
MLLKNSGTETVTFNVAITIPKEQRVMVDKYCEFSGLTIKEFFALGAGHILKADKDFKTKLRESQDQGPESAERAK